MTHSTHTIRSAFVAAGLRKESPREARGEVKVLATCRHCRSIHAINPKRAGCPVCGN